MKFLLVSKKYGDIYFDADSDDAAEDYVEETYDSSDGEMTLYRLEHVCGWP